jgi:hypothetical protein
MSREHKSAAAPILAVLAIVLAMLGAYVGGYFWLGERQELNSVQTTRVYSARWQGTVFGPIAWVEGKLSRREVLLLEEIDGAYSTIFSSGVGFP